MKTATTNGVSWVPEYDGVYSQAQVKLSVNVRGAKFELLVGVGARALRAIFAADMCPLCWPCHGPRHGVPGREGQYRHGRATLRDVTLFVVSQPFSGRVTHIEPVKGFEGKDYLIAVNYQSRGVVVLKDVDLANFEMC